MATSADLTDFGEEQLRDSVILNYRPSGIFLQGSLEAEDLCDEIQRLEIALWSYRRQEIRIPNGEDRSTTIFEALKFYRDYRQSQVESCQFEEGEL
jgi:hypothetical protein